MISENAKTIINFLKDNEGDFTAADIAEALDLPVKTVNGCFTSAVQRKEWGYREPVTIEVDGTDKEGNAIKVQKEIKLFRLTDAGKALDCDAFNAAEEAEKAAAKAAKEAAKAAKAAN